MVVFQGEWVYPLLKASLSIGWLPSYYINHNLVLYLVTYARSKKSIINSLYNWKRQVVGLQEEDINKILYEIKIDLVSSNAASSSNASSNSNSRIILGLYALALMEQNDANDWLINWEKALQIQYKNNHKYLNSRGDIRILTNSLNV